MKIIQLSTINLDNIIDSLIEMVDINYSTLEMSQGNVDNMEEQIVQQTDMINDEPCFNTEQSVVDDIEPKSFDKGFILFII